MDYSEYQFHNDPRIFNHSYNYDLSIPMQTCLDLKSDDELFVETWLSKIGKININLDSSIEINHAARALKVQPKCDIKIGNVKNSLGKCLEIMDKLKATRGILQENVSTMTSDEWKKRTIEIGSLRDELSTIMLQFQNKDNLKTIQRQILKRSKKRQRGKRRKIELREQSNAEKNRLHKQIDQWLENMKETVERAKAEENMKKDADCVLAEVTKKKSDARKQLNLVSALVRLRNVRESAAMQRGEKVSPEDGCAFRKAAEHLTNMWEDCFRTYSKEEQGLKIMLEQNASEDGRITGAGKEKKIAMEWERVLFGPNIIGSNPIYWGLTSAERDLETFVAIRKSWDTFLTSDEETGSKIPIGWVLPGANSTSDWTKYLD